MKHNERFFYTIIILSMAGWAGSWVSVKVLADYIGAYEVVFLRYLLTSLGVLPFLLYQKMSFKISLPNLALSLVATALLIAYTKYFYLGVKLGTASLGGAFVTTLIPILTFVILVVFGARKIALKDILALALGTIGVFTILNVWTFGLAEIMSEQNLYFVVAAFVWALLTIVSSRASDISQLVFMFYVYVFTTVFSFVLFIDVDAIEYKQFDFLFYFNMTSISLISTAFATTAYFWAMESIGAAKVSTFLFLVPFMAIFLGAVFLGEEVGVVMILGTVLSILAVRIINKK